MLVYVLQVWYLCCIPIVLMLYLLVCSLSAVRQGETAPAAQRDANHAAREVAQGRRLPCAHALQVVLYEAPLPRLVSEHHESPPPAPPPTPRPPPGQTAPSPTIALKHNTQTQTDSAFTRPQHWNTTHRLKQTQHTDSNKLWLTTALKHNTQTQTNHAFTDHSTETQHTGGTGQTNYRLKQIFLQCQASETQHTDSNKSCLHWPQHWNTTHRLKTALKHNTQNQQTVPSLTTVTETEHTYPNKICQVHWPQTST